MGHLRAFFSDRAGVALIATFVLSFVVAAGLRIKFNPFRNTRGKKSPWGYRTLSGRIRHPFYLAQVLAEPGIMLALRGPLAILIEAASIHLSSNEYTEKNECFSTISGRNTAAIAHILSASCGMSTSGRETGFKFHRDLGEWSANKK
jgi:hypothetical protein